MKHQDLRVGLGGMESVMKKFFAILVILAATSTVARADNLEIIQQTAMKIAVSGNQHGAIPQFSNAEIQQLEMMQDSASESEAGKIGYLLQRIAEIQSANQ